MVRDHCFNKESSSHKVVLVQLSSVACCVWSGEARLARRVIDGCIVGASHLSLVSGRPQLTHPEELEENSPGKSSGSLRKRRLSLLRDHRSLTLLEALRSPSRPILLSEARLSVLEPHTYRLLAYESMKNLLENLPFQRVVTMIPTLCERIMHCWQPIFNASGCNARAAKSLIRKYIQSVKWK